MDKAVPSEERREYLTELIKALTAVKREIGYIDVSEEEAKRRDATAAHIRELKKERGVRSYRDYKWANQSHCGYCGSTRVRARTHRPAYIEVECHNCDFIDFKDVS